MPEIYKFKKCPEKTVIPQFVAEWIEECKKQRRCLRDSISKSAPFAVASWLMHFGERYNYKNQDIFARAWLDGYEAEKEKKTEDNLKVKYDIEEIAKGIKSFQKSLIQTPLSIESINSVDKPIHYIGKYGLEAIDVVRNFVGDLSAIEGFYWGNSMKYMLRFQHKNGLEDLKKARKNLDWMIEEKERAERENQL